MGEPYVPQEAHQRFLIEAWFFLGKNFPHPLYRSVCELSLDDHPILAAVCVDATETLGTRSRFWPRLSGGAFAGAGAAMAVLNIGQGVALKTGVAAPHQGA